MKSSRAAFPFRSGSGNLDTSGRMNFGTDVLQAGGQKKQILFDGIGGIAGNITGLGGKPWGFNFGGGRFTATSGAFNGQTEVDATMTFGYNMTLGGAANTDVSWGFGFESRYLNATSGLSSEWYLAWQSQLSGANFISRRPIQCNVNHIDSGDVTKFISQVDWILSADTWRISSYSAAVANAGGGALTAAGTFNWDGKNSYLQLSNAAGSARLVTDEIGFRTADTITGVVGNNYGQLNFRNATTGYTAADGMAIGTDNGTLDMIFFNRENSDIRITTNAGSYNDLMRLTKGQRVFIGFDGSGIVDAGSRLQVKGDILATGTSDTLLRVVGGTYPGIKIVGTGAPSGVDIACESNTYFLFRTQDNLPFRFQTWSTDRFEIHTDIKCFMPLKLANAFAAGAPAATGYVTVKDSTGTTYKLLCAP